MNRPVSALAFLCWLWLMLASSACVRSPAPLSRDDIEDNNHAVALMGRYEYAAAEKIFYNLAQKHPDQPDLSVNWAIALLNQQDEVSLSTARTLVAGVLQAHPDHLRARYVIGLLDLYAGSPEALNQFRKVADTDSTDAYAAYYVGQCLGQQDQHEEALTWYRRAAATDSYLRSAYYGAFVTLKRLQREEEAEQMLSAYQRLDKNPQARLAEIKYTRMGPKAEAIAIDLPGAKPPAAPSGPLFAAPHALEASANASWKPVASDHPSSITAADIDADGNLDLFIAGALSGPAVNAVLLQRNDGDFELALDHPLASVAAVNAALWGDYDNDGTTDVYLCRRGPNQLWRQDQNKRWADVTLTTRTAADHLNTIDGAFVDADHDGDLDLLLVNQDGPNELLNNNRDGTFRPIAAEQGIAGDGRASRGLVTADLDADRDLDIVILHETPPHEVYLNDRSWSYHKATGFDDLVESPTLAAVAGDLDADGQVELYATEAGGQVARWQPDDHSVWRRQALPIDPARSKQGHSQIALVDIDGSGAADLVLTDGDGWAVVDASTGRRRYGAQDAHAGWAPIAFGAQEGASIVGVPQTGPPSLWAPGTGRYPFAALVLSGRDEHSESMRSNASGIGARIAFRIGSRWTAASTLRHHSGPGQSLQPLVVGLGGDARLDFAQIEWSDGVLQTELDLAAAKLHRIEEKQRQLSSCPVLFAWNGHKYEFVSDLLGVGGIGYATAPGEYAPPRPRESLLLPSGLLQPRDGRFHLKIGEPMEEAGYLDAARLTAYDLPPGWHMTLDERMGIAGPEPTSEPRFYRQALLPVAAVNDRGENVLDALITADLRAAPIGPVDRRFIGRLEADHVLTLTFPRPLAAAPGTPILIADGWIEYPYSQTMFAAWQAGAAFRAPTIEVRAADGEWKVLLAEFGYPAGMPRQMSVPLPPLPANTTQLRLQTNYEIYWDRVVVAYAEADPGIGRHRLPLAAAELLQTGFARRTTGAQRVPYYDYNKRDPLWDARYMRGFYTTFGAVTDLVRTVDDAVAVYGPGEEVHLEFESTLGALSPGWARFFVLEANGWAKDMDLYTRDAETVEPLPSSGKPSSDRDRLHARYNLRYRSGS